VDELASSIGLPPHLRENDALDELYGQIDWYAATQHDNGSIARVICVYIYNILCYVYFSRYGPSSLDTRLTPADPCILLA
jgi:hypothetical protein